MTTVRRSLGIAALLVFGVTPVFAQPGPATLISPSSDVVGTTITFTWQSAPTASWYHFWLGKVDTSLVLEQWYTAEHAGCAGGGTCSITVTPSLTGGPFLWHIRTWSSAGYGPWSPAHMFSVRNVVQAWSTKLPPSRRFSLVLGDEAVLDNETGLVWERSLSPQVTRWSAGARHCAFRSASGRFGFRMPTLSEVRTLMDMANNPMVPAGHPFNLVQPLYIWTETPVPGQSLYFLANFLTGNVVEAADHSEVQFHLWCVRGGASPGQ
jgi:hypothetical protein